MRPSWLYSLSPNPATTRAILDTRERLESAGLLKVVPSPAGTVLSWDEWHVLRNEYAYAVFAKIPFCWIHTDLADHLREIARWSESEVGDDA